MDFELFCNEVKSILLDKELTVVVVDHVYKATWYTPEEVCSHKEKMTFREIFDQTIGYENNVDAMIRDEVYEWLDSIDGEGLEKEDATDIAQVVYERILNHYMDEVYEALNNYSYRLNDYAYC